MSDRKKKKKRLSKKQREYQAYLRLQENNKKRREGATARLAAKAKANPKSTAELYGKETKKKVVKKKPSYGIWPPKNVPKTPKSSGSRSSGSSYRSTSSNYRPSYGAGTKTYGASGGSSSKQPKRSYQINNTSKSSSRSGGRTYQLKSRTGQSRGTGVGHYSNAKTDYLRGTPSYRAKIRQTTNRYGRPTTGTRYKTYKSNTPGNRYN